jgi:hypothetical protein
LQEAGSALERVGYAAQAQAPRRASKLSNVADRVKTELAAARVLKLVIAGFYERDRR